MDFSHLSLSEKADNTNTPISGVSLDVSLTQSINYASLQNSVPFLKSLKLMNTTANFYRDLRLTMFSEPAFIQAKTWNLDQLAPGASLDIPNREVEIDQAYVNRLNEAERGQVTFQLIHDSQKLAKQMIDIRILARDEWCGFRDNPELLAAFVTPNDPAVTRILKKSSQILARSGHSDSLEGYQGHDPKRVYMQAAAIWSALSEEGLTYSNPPKSFEQDGQKIRQPATILNDGLATCLDTSLLFAAALEAIHINPVLILVDGHCFAGFWLTETRFSNLIETDPTEIRKAISANELIVFETTLITSKPLVDFNETIKAGKHKTRESVDEEFVGAIDISRARMSQIRPLKSDVEAKQVPISQNQQKVAVPLPPLPSFEDMPVDEIEQKPTTPEGRVERWQRKLLDLSLRNRLLNFRPSKQTIPFVCPDVHLLEDKLAEQKSIQVISLPDSNPMGDRDESLHFQKTGQDLNLEFAMSALQRNELASPLTKTDLDSRLTNLYRTSRNDLAEGGSNTLFLAVGFLKWKRNANDEKSYRAPILLVPVKLERKSALSQFKIKHHEDEVRFNSTLVQLLKKDFDRDISSLESNLPRDESGIDVPKVLQKMRAEIREIPGFEVVDETALSTFSFSKYLMWKDLVDRTGHLEENRVVRHLIRDPDKVFESPTNAPIPEPEQIDHRYTSSELVHPLSADSSQLAAIMAASEGHDFVLIGPPGTGKSQTIANMIAQCLVTGKSVLFVAEKTAALDVVYRRLRQHGLGDVCLELHSNKAERRQFLEQMKNSWNSGLQKQTSQWVTINERLQVRRDELNHYVEALHREHASGWSVFQAMGVFVKSKDLSVPRLDWPLTQRIDQSRYQVLTETVKSLELSFQAITPTPALEVIESGQWSAAWESQLLSSCVNLQGRCETLKKSLKEFASGVGFEDLQDCSPDLLEKLNNLARLLKSSAGESYRIIFDKKFPKLPEQFAPVAKLILAYRKSRDFLSAQYDTAHLAQIPVEEMDLNWRKASTKIWPFSYFAKRSVIKLLQSYAVSGEVDPFRDLGTLQKMQKYSEQFVEPDLADQLPGWDGLETDIESVKAYLKRASQVRQNIIELGKAMGSLEKISSKISPIIIQENATHTLLGVADRFQSDYAAFIESLNQFMELAGGSLKNQTSDHHLASTMELATEIQQHRTELKRWTAWTENRQQAVAMGLQPFVDHLQSGALSAEQLSQGFELAFVRWWLPLAIDESEILRKFQRYLHEDAITDFRALDDRARKEAASHVRAEMTHDLPKPDKVPRKSELGLLRHQMNLKRPSKSIREVIEGMPGAFNKLAPCLLMSPLSIAQYLPADQQPFDVVIFDEASQITTWDAIGAIARGRQTIIVGDPKQLPPTNFFGRSDSDEDEEMQDYERDLESILDEAIASGLPVRRLDWHYRSQHESLIAFSNWNYYDNKLVTFPSTATADQAVSLVHLPEAIYDKGKSRTNPMEAKRLVQDAIEKMKAWLKLPQDNRPTLGVITFNSQQQSLIQDYFDAELRNSPELEWFFDDGRIEPTVVKNLENVQGDERDVMLFSITYGPDKVRRSTGNPGASFGPLNLQGGERRLNVAVTRARQELIVYSSFLPDQLKADKAKYQGVPDLKAFLEYAQKGASALAASHVKSVGEFESPFEEAVAIALTKLGWQVVPQIGVSAFRVDLGVVHPDKPGTFLAGIECDGATYHRSATARDRDKIREQVLRGLGWEILRIWSPDWWYDTQGAVTEMDRQLSELLSNQREATVEETEDVFEDDSSIEELSENESDLRSYLAEFSIDAESFYKKEYNDTLSGMINAIIENEAPLRKDLLGQIIARAHGWKRTGSKIQKRISALLRSASKTEESSGTFIWPHGEIPDLIEYRSSSSYFQSRSIGDIPLAELCGFIRSHKECLADIDPATSIARELGVNRLTAGSRERLEEAIDQVNLMEN
ncbi:DUF3320 domain-containing protein [Rubinisphaera sp.]|uniref:DUF3320 domain-containing protein n=1 Tax=Rubinisphaera sp. TaxID=2024857 RepID=UPI0025E418F3|nr:DUF3320 domain-containing protein [Rubinisphaera sp.]